LVFVSDFLVFSCAKKTSLWGLFTAVKNIFLCTLLKKKKWKKSKKKGRFFYFFFTAEFIHFLFINFGVIKKLKKIEKTSRFWGVSPLFLGRGHKKNILS
jgi:hypothetical protein